MYNLNILSPKNNLRLFFNYTMKNSKIHIIWKQQKMGTMDLDLGKYHLFLFECLTQCVAVLITHKELKNIGQCYGTRVWVRDTDLLPTYNLKHNWTPT